MTGPLPSHRVQPTPELFQRAIDVLHERGWAKAKFTTPDGLCLLGACAVAAGFNPDEGAFIVRVYDFLSEVLLDGQSDPQSFLRVTEFYDAAESVGEIIAFLQTAAEEVNR